MRTANYSSRVNSVLAKSLASVVLMVALVGCPSVQVPSPGGGTANLPKKASDWVSFVNWEKAERKQVVAVENDDEHWLFMPDPDLEVSEWHLKPDSQDADRYFAAGIPYILEMINPSTNSVRHDFRAPDFYKAIATYKVRTNSAEYEAPYFDNFDIGPGERVELYFVPVLPGTYDMWCTILGHREAGKKGTYTITDGEGLELDLEVAADFDAALATDPRRSGSHEVWQEAALATQTVTLTEFGFEPSEYTLTANVGYRLSIVAVGTNESEHHCTAAGFFETVVTRTARDSQAEIRAPYFNAIELLAGRSVDLYIVPTVAGSYNLICTVRGHAELGMTGTITVQ